MADTFKGIITADGKKRQLPYGAVLDRPVSDKTLSEEGGFADAKVVGDNFAKADSETASLKEDIDNLTSWDLKGDIAYGKLPKNLVSVSKTTLTTIKSIKSINGVATFEGDNVTFKNDTGKQGTYNIMFGEPFEIKESDYAYLMFNDLEAYGTVSTIALLDSNGNTISSTVQYITPTSTFWKLINSNDIKIYGISIDIPVPSYNKTVKFYIGLGTDTRYPTYEPRYQSRIAINNDKMFGKTFLSYGDSQTAQGKWQPYVADALNMKSVVFGFGGYPVAQVNPSNIGWSLSSDFLLNELEKKIQECNPDIITVMGLTNDFNYDGTDDMNNITIGDNESTDLKTVKGALKAIVAYIQNRHPEITVVLMSPCGGLTKQAGKNISTPLKNANGYTLADFAKATKEIAEWIGVPFIDVYGCGITIYNSATYIEDGVHMNSEQGAKLVANKVINGLKSIMPAVN